MQTLINLLQNDTIRLMFALVIQIGLSYPLRTFQSINIRYMYSLILGTLLQILVFGWQALIILFFGICSYYLTKYTGQKCGGIVTFISMVLLSGYHLYGVIQKYGENKMDQVVLLMIMVCRYSLFSYSYADGHYRKQINNKQKKQVVIKKQSTQTTDNEKDQKKQQKIKVNQQNKITQQVKLYEYIGYLQFLPTSVMGPPIQYRIYEQFIKKQGKFAQIQKFPSRKSIMLQTCKQLIGCLALYATGMFVFPPEFMITQQFYKFNGLVIFVYSVISLTLIRFKYYSAWKIGILSVHSSGLSYNETRKDYSSIDHCKVIKIQTTPHIRQKIGNWNITVQEWLRKCIYQRAPFKSRFAGQLWVFMVSAFWHGFYAGYYFSFFLWFAQVYVQTQIFKRSKNDNSKFTRLYNKLGRFSTLIAVFSSVLFSHNATFFVLLRASLCIKFMERVYYIPQLLLPLGIIYLAFLPKKKQSQNSVKSGEHQHKA